MQIENIAVLVPDNDNANLGTAVGGVLLAKSLRENGAGRSVLADKNGRLIAGNKTLERAIAEGITEVIIVPSDGTKLVVVQRTDVDLDSRRGRELALADNKVSELNLSFDDDVVRRQAEAFNIDLPDWGFTQEQINDFSGKNREVDIDSLEELMELKFKVSKDDYFNFTERLNDVCNREKVATIEDALRFLLSFYEDRAA